MIGRLHRWLRICLRRWLHRGMFAPLRTACGFSTSAITSSAIASAITRICMICCCAHNYQSANSQHGSLTAARQCHATTLSTKYLQQNALNKTLHAALYLKVTALRLKIQPRLKITPLFCNALKKLVILCFRAY